MFACIYREIKKSCHGILLTFHGAFIMDEQEQAQPVVARKNVFDLTWMDTRELSRFVTETGRIISRKYTRLSAKEQRRVTCLVKRARNMLLMK
ncbi:MAG: ribosomal protein S18 [Puniceicoccales bacterium]|nr:ribosomal protein S18 [Puniceicoccales bacterium]